jgi:hypothetical protein
MTARRKIILWTVVIALGAGSAAVVLGVRSYERRKRPAYLRGAIIRQNTDTRKQSPVDNVEITASEGSAMATTKSDFAGGFALRLPAGMAIGDPIKLSFRQPDYQPLDLQEHAADTLYVVRMVPLHGEVEAELDLTAASITNVLVRYSTQASTTSSIGTDATTFQVVNSGNVACNRIRPCSPDGRWKAAVASASLDAGDGNVFRNARVSCIAGPCPFTKIDSDGFSRGGQKIGVTARDWSDTTTFLLQAEVFRTQISDTVRDSYPVIAGRALDFTVPGSAEGTSVEAEINGVNIVFPLAPNPTLSWADCNVRVEKNNEKDYRCELKPGYRFP